MSSYIESALLPISDSLLSSPQKLVLIEGHILHVLQKLPSDYVDLIITSPPYWGLRDYGEETVTVWDGSEDCEHDFGELIQRKYHKAGETNPGKEYYTKEAGAWGQTSGQFCQKCNAWRGQLGLEPSLELYLSHLLQVTAELKRVLKPTGILFWNQGDSYSGNMGKRSGWSYVSGINEIDNEEALNRGISLNFKPDYQSPQKCLNLQNFRLVQRMVDTQGWILRNVIQWVKPNHMPSSVQDRFTNGYEPIFMLTKSQRYWFDLDNVREEAKDKEGDLKRINADRKRIYNVKSGNVGSPRAWEWNKQVIDLEDMKGKNPGDIWTIPTQPFPDCHFAVFPEELPERCIKCACPKEICTKCGKARVRIIGREKTPYMADGSWEDDAERMGITGTDGRGGRLIVGLNRKSQEEKLYSGKTIGWTDCSCEDREWRPGIVLDPFIGSGTTMKVARRMGMSCIGIDINPKYIEMVKEQVRWNESLGIEFKYFKC